MHISCIWQEHVGICGAIAQLGERYNGIVEVVGSIPIGSTIQPRLTADKGQAPLRGDLHQPYTSLCYVQIRAEPADRVWRGENGYSLHILHKIMLFK